MQEWLVMGLTTAKRLEPDGLGVEIDIVANESMRPNGVDRVGTAQQADGTHLRTAADQDDRADPVGMQVRAPGGRERPSCGCRLDTDGGALPVDADIAREHSWRAASDAWWKRAQALACQRPRFPLKHSDREMVAPQ